MSKHKTLVLVLLALSIVAVAHAATYETNYTTQSGVTKDANIAVRTLKYDPYPVNPGAWFDLWIQVENVGQADIQNIAFELHSDYPFEVRDGAQTMNVLSGTVSAHGTKVETEETPEANRVLLKYRVYVDESAAEGTHNAQLAVRYENTNSVRETTYNIPVAVQKTKTDFTVTMHDSNSRRTTFTVLNSGEKTASAVTVALAPQAAQYAKGTTSAVIGTLAPGEFTTVSFALDTNTTIHEVPMVLSYTDAVGARTQTTQKVPVALQADEQQLAPVVVAKNLFGVPIQWVYGFIGLVLGIIIALILSRVTARE